MPKKTTQCPRCRVDGVSVIESRKSEWRGTPTVRRRKHCAECGYRYTTYEIPEVLLSPEKVFLDAKSVFNRLRDMNFFTLFCKE